MVLLFDEGIWQNIWALIETPKLILVSSKITLALHCQAPDKIINILKIRIIVRVLFKKWLQRLFKNMLYFCNSSR